MGRVKEESLRRMRHQMQDHFRENLINPQQMPPKQRAALRPFAEGALASVAHLEAAYFRDRNPVHVWNAMMQIHYAMPILNRPVVLPPWVLAYLFRAAQEIMGRAVGYPKGDRQRPMRPSKNADGTTTRYSDWFAGLKAQQRRDVVLEALGFKGARGWNPLAQAHRDHLRENRVRMVNSLRLEGHSAREAAEKLDDADLKMSADRARKIRRDKRRLRGES
jgi:hypothetical protein